MPLAFASLSHGTVAFGFYNIETDGLLLDRLFFFCTDFCTAVCELASLSWDAGQRTSLPGFSFRTAEEIGDLGGAIRGTHHRGFLGEVYLLWPFPTEAAAFRQKLGGASNRPLVEAILKRRAEPVSIDLVVEGAEGLVRVAEYAFSRRGFLDIVAYVERGGYPTWEGYEEGRRPAYVARMAAAIGDGGNL